MPPAYRRGMEKETDKPVSRYAGLQAKEHKCPQCGSIIYSRRNVLCGVCGERLPEELLFQGKEREMVEKNLKAARKGSMEASRPDAPRMSNTGGLPIL